MQTALLNRIEYGEHQINDSELQKVCMFLHS